jgi:hypothetical protein
MIPDRPPRFPSRVEAFSAIGSTGDRGARFGVFERWRGAHEFDAAGTIAGSKEEA